MLLSHFSVHCTPLRFNGHFPNGSGLAGTGTSPFWILLRAKDDVCGGDNLSYKTCKAVNRHRRDNRSSSFYRPDALHVTQPTALECEVTLGVRQTALSRSPRG